jgi:hypothetical protein
MLRALDIRAVFLLLSLFYVLGDEWTMSDIPSVWNSGDFVPNDLAQGFIGNFSLEAAIDQALDEHPPPLVLRKTITLQPLNPDYSFNISIIDNSSYTWEFMSVIMIPPLTCQSTAMVVPLFNQGLCKVNPTVKDEIRSYARRVGAEACEDGVCPCEGGGGDVRYVTRVLEVVTVSTVRSLFLPNEDEFPFLYDSRTMIPPLKKKRGRLLDGDISAFTLYSLGATRLRFVDKLFDNSEIRFSNSKILWDS